MARGRPEGPGRPDGTARARVDAETAPLTVAAVANRLGVAASTLRTWDRRYGLGPSSHQAGSHRRYTPEDVARLETMRRLTLRGVAPADAARIAADDDGALAAPGPEEGEGRAEPSDEQLIIDPLTLAAAAVEPDPPRLQRMLSRAVAERGIVETWTEVAKPALAMLRQRDRVERPGMDPEGVLDFAMLAAVREVTARLERSAREPGGPAERRGDVPGDGPAQDGAPGGAHAETEAAAPRPGSVLLYASGESRLRAHVLGAGLLELGVRARVVRARSGAGVPELLDLARDQQAGALAVLGAPAGAADLVRAASEGGDLEVFLLGHDAPELWLPRVRRVRTAVAAVHEIAGVLGA